MSKMIVQNLPESHLWTDPRNAQNDSGRHRRIHGSSLFWDEHSNTTYHKLYHSNTGIVGIPLLENKQVCRIYQIPISCFWSIRNSHPWFFRVYLTILHHFPVPVFTKFDKKWGTCCFEKKNELISFQNKSGTQSVMFRNFGFPDKIKCSKKVSIFSYIVWNILVYLNP